MAYEKQFAIKEVASLNISGYSDGNAIAHIPYANEVSIVSETSRLNIYGGKSNSKFLSWDYGKDIKLKIKLPLFDLNLLAHLAGTDLLQGEGTSHNDEKLVVESAVLPTITLSATPINNSLKVYVMNSPYDIGAEQTLGDPINSNEYSIVGTTITLNTATAPLGTKILAMYDYTVLNDSHLIQMFVDRFVKYVRITGKGTWRNVATQIDEEILFDFKKCKINPSFAMQQSSTSASYLELDIDVYHKPIGNRKIHASIISEGNYASFKRLITSEDELFLTVDDMEFWVAG